MTKLIAETAWHHEGDFGFMTDMVGAICEQTAADIVKMHITLDLDAYMSSDHEAYGLLKSWMLSAEQWESLIGMVKRSGKQLMLLLNDTQAVEFAGGFDPDLVELHSVCLNVPRLQRAFLEQFGGDTLFVIGVGGCSLEEVDAAIRAFGDREMVLMFGFQNYPTKYEEINLRKIRRIQAAYAGKQFGYADHTAWNEPNNALITLLVAANGMDYVEKHVTTAYGQERCDYNAAIALDMLNGLAEKLKILDRVGGNGTLALNTGERAYSRFGPMKMAAMAARDLEVGHILSEKDIDFRRGGVITDLSQLEAIQCVGHSVNRPVRRMTPLRKEDFCP